MSSSATELVSTKKDAVDYDNAKAADSDEDGSVGPESGAKDEDWVDTLQVRERGR